jgi:hypothetical protein
MKTILIAWWMLFSVGLCYSQVANVPGTIQKKFQQSYPSAAAVEWQAMTDHYKVMFTDKKNLHHTIVYDKEGKILTREEEMDDQSVMTSIREYFIKNFPDKKDSRVWKVEDETGKISYYSPVEDAVIFFDENGKFVRRDERTPENMDPEKEHK